MILAQTMAEYGLLNSLVAGFANLQYRIETYIGQGNSKYLLLGALVLLILLLARNRR